MELAPLQKETPEHSLSASEKATTYKAGTEVSPEVKPRLAPGLSASRAMRKEISVV